MKNLLLALIIIPCFAHATTYYISPTGSSGNPGTIGSPWNLFKLQTVGVLSPGDTVFLRGGTYRTESPATLYIQLLIQNMHGAAGNLIYIWAYPGEKPVFNLDNVISLYPATSQVCLYLEHVSYVHFKGLRITGLKQYRPGLYGNPPYVPGSNPATDGAAFGCRTAGTNNCIFEQLEFDHIGGWGVTYATSSNNLWKNCDFHHLDDRYSGENPWNGADGIVSSASGGTVSQNNVFDGCRAWLVSDDGFDFWQNKYSKTIKNCWSFWNGYYQDEGMATRQPACTGGSCGNGNGIKMGPATGNAADPNIAEYRFLIHNNLVFENLHDGMDQNYLPTTLFEIYNNTVYGNGQNQTAPRLYVGIKLQWPEAAPYHKIYNNVAYKNGVISGVAEDFRYNGPGGNGNYYTVTSGNNHNTWNTGGPTVTDADFLSVSSVGMDAPRGPNGELPVTNFLKLAQGSDLINAGTNIGYGTDLGAFPFAAASNPTVTINQAVGQADPTSSSPINFTVIFNQVVTGFATGDVTLSGTAGATTGIVTGSGSTYNVAVTGMIANGTVIASINAGVCVNSVSATNLASTSTDNTVTYNLPATPPPPAVGTITQPTCTVATGSVVLNGLPASVTWTLTRTPGGVTTTGSGTSITITGLSVGTYTYTVSIPSGTSAPSANIIINPQPATPSTPTVGTITQPSCAVATGSVVINNLPATGTWTLTRTPGNVTTTGTGTSTTINGLATGTYSYTVTNAAGCVSAASANVVIIVQPATPSAPTVGTITQPSCAVATGSVVINNLPATGTWTLTRTPGNVTTTGTGTSTTINGLATGTYSYTVTNAAGCISAASANVVIIVQPATPSTPTVGTITQPSCAVATGSVVINNLPATGTWTLTRTPGNVTTTGTGTSTTINGLATGTYSYTVTNAAGCISAASANVVIIVQPATPSAPTVGTITQPSCAVATGSVVINNLPATGTWTLTRTPGNVTTTGTGTSTTINGLATGTYSYTVTNAAGCISAASANVVIIVQPATPSAPTVGTITQPSCAVATGSVVINNLPATGTWTLTRTPGNVTTTGTGTSTTINGLATGTYSYTVTNAAGCISAASANVVIIVQPATPSAPTVGTITQPSCAVATGSVVINNLPATGTWTLTRTPGNVTTTGTGTSTTINGLATGTYSYTVTNASGCISANSANVTVNTQPATPSAPAVGAVTQPSCAVATGSVVLSGLPATGTWTLTRTPGNVTTTGTGTSTTINGLATGTYSYTVTNASGCISANSANVTVNTQPATPSAPAVGAVTQPSCAVATGSVVLSGLPATGTWTLTRTPGNVTTTGTGTSTTINGLATGTYSYTVTNASGCISAASANVVIIVQPATPSTPTVGTITQPSCAVATGSVVINNLPATGAWTLTRTPGNVTTTGTGTSTTINGLAPGTYTYMVTNASGCTSAASANIVIITQPGSPGTPAVGTITQPTCTVATGSVVLNNLPATGTWTLTRNPGNITTTGTGTSTTIAGLGAGTYTYTVANSSGCISAVSANVVINAQPATPASPAVGTITHPTCAVATGSVVLSNLPAAGTWTLTRNPGGITTTGTGTSATIAGLTAGSYTYTVANASGCTSASSANMVINAQPASPSTPGVGTITQPTCIVATGTVILNNLPATGTWTLTRNPGNITTTGTGTSTTISGLNTGTYTYTVANASGCNSTASANVIINIQPLASAPVVGTITQPTCTLATGSVILNALPATGTWTLTRNPGNITTTGTGTSTTITGLDAGTYTYTVTNASGCTSAASGAVVVGAQPATVSSPFVGTITHPTCAIATGTVVLHNLPVTGTWTLTRNPGGVTTTGTGSSATINGLTGGTYTYTVTNASGCTSPASANVVINAQPAIPSAPVIGIITQPTNAVPTGTVALSGLPATGTWTLTINPGGTTVTGTGTYTLINGLAPGTYSYMVTNASGCISLASLNVVINAVPNMPPTANAGSDINITLPTNFTTLTGIGTDVDGTIVGYEWKQLSGPSTNVLFSVNTAVTYANNLIEGVYQFEFVVTDNQGAKGRDSLNVTVLNILPPAAGLQNNSIRIYPNPVVDITTLEINKTNENVTVLQIITDVQGKTLLAKELTSQQNTILEKIDMRNFAKGIYFVTVMFKDFEKKTLKVIKTN